MLSESIVRCVIGISLGKIDWPLNCGLQIRKSRTRFIYASGVSEFVRPPVSFTMHLHKRRTSHNCTHDLHIYSTEERERH